MHCEFTAIPDADVPQAVEPIFQHAVVTYASEANKTASVWRAVPDALLDVKPHEKTNPIRTILVHQLLSEKGHGRVLHGSSVASPVAHGGRVVICLHRPMARR